ncbi:MAG: acyltransferase [Terriglobales bacterium]|jgi:acetyltransferase-like isoleucine patch superfamily enzyme
MTQSSLRGRDLFLMMRPVLRTGTAFLAIFPRWICEIALDFFRYVPTKLGIAIRYMFVARLARSCGDNVAIFEGVHLFKVSNISIGSNVSIHQMCYIDATGGLKIGSDVAIAHATTIMTSEHDYSKPLVTTRDAEGFLAPVELEDDVWVGAGVRILSGITIGAHSVIAAGAVVTKDVSGSSLMVGVPARRLKMIRQVPYETSVAVRP